MDEEMADGFEISGKIRHAETFASGRGIRELARLRRTYGLGNWRKRKGFATVRLTNGDIREAEVHWYEANGIGSKEYKIARFVD